jgi:hypothetical protein
MQVFRITSLLSECICSEVSRARFVNRFFVHVFIEITEVEVTDFAILNLFL